MHELPHLATDESVRKVMFGLEKIARAHAAPELLVRAAHGVASCALSLVLTEARGPEAVERAGQQLVSALVRLTMAAVRAGAPLPEVVRCLAGEAAAG